MNMDQIYELALRYGGITYSLHTTRTVDEGYAVSPYPFAERKQQLTSLNLQYYVSEHYHLLRKANNCLGLWYNEDSREWYFDVVMVVNSKSEAHRIAVQCTQLAYFDLKNQVEIRV